MLKNWIRANRRKQKGQKRGAPLSDHTDKGSPYRAIRSDLVPVHTIDTILRNMLSISVLYSLHRLVIGTAVPFF